MNYKIGGSHWVIDSGCTQHMTSDPHMFTSLDEEGYNYLFTIIMDGTSSNSSFRFDATLLAVEREKRYIFITFARVALQLRCPARIRVNSPMQKVSHAPPLIAID